MNLPGRPLKSDIRQNIVEILHFMGEGYAYEIYKVYSQIFPKITMRSVYYNLNKGADIGVFKVKEIRKVQGNYSWGQSAEKIFYSLGEFALPTGNLLVREHFQSKQEKDI